MKVSDWSQPIKIAIFLSFAVGVAAFIFLALIPFGREVLELLREIAQNTP